MHPVDDEAPALLDATTGARTRLPVRSRIGIQHHGVLSTTHALVSETVVGTGHGPRSPTVRRRVMAFAEPDTLLAPVSTATP